MLLKDNLSKLNQMGKINAYLCFQKSSLIDTKKKNEKNRHLNCKIDSAFEGQIVNINIKLEVFKSSENRHPSLFFSAAENYRLCHL